MASKNSLIREQAAQMVARGRLTHTEIAARLGIGARSLSRWNNAPRFAARVEEIKAEITKRATKYGLAVKANRIEELTKQFNALEQIIEDRRADTRFAAIPDWSSGLRTITQFTLIRGASQSQGNGSSQGQQISAQTNGPANGHTHDAPGADGAQVEPLHSEISFLNERGKIVVKTELDLSILKQQRDILADIAAETGDRAKSLFINPKRPADMTEDELNEYVAELDKILGNPPEPVPATNETIQ